MGTIGGTITDNSDPGDSGDRIISGKATKHFKALHRWSDNFEKNSANGYFLLIL